MGKEASMESIVHRSSSKKNIYGSIDDNSSKSQIKQRNIAARLLDKLQEPSSWKFYLKCAYHLSEDQIWKFVELATKPQVKSPNRYFVYLASKEMRK